MKCFLHDAHALEDEKVAELQMAFGYEGYGLFFAILEKLAAQEKPIKTAVLKRQLGVGKKLEKCWSFIEQIGLISSSNGETSNIRIISYVQTFNKQQEKNRERVSQWRENQQHPKNVTDTEQARNDPNTTEDKVNKEKNNNTDDANAPSESVLFDQFWMVYDKKVDRKKCQAKFTKLSKTVQQLILENVPLYVKANPNAHYRKNPLTYLTGECWKDPLTPSSNRPAANGGLVV